MAAIFSFDSGGMAVHGTTNISSGEMFHCLEQLESRKGAFGLSLGVHVVLLITALLVHLVFTPAVKVKHQMVVISLPPAEQLDPDREVIEWKQPSPKMPEPLKAPPPQDSVLTPEALSVPEPIKPEPAKPEPAPLPKVVEPESIPAVAPVVRTVDLRPETPAPIAAPKLGVITDVFSTDTAAKQTNIPAREIQTSRFGAVNGTAAARSNRAPVSGTFDGVSGAARGGSPKADVDRNIRQGSFADAEPAGPAQVSRKLDAQPHDTPAEITFKPRPNYTEEARRLRLEGEVVLRVHFTATGEVRILELVRGLGHGLDENAVSAAQRIKFKPALRNGEPIDSTATVHIAFQLAY